MPAQNEAGVPAKQKIIVLGGGCGGVASAFWLSSTAALRERFEVTLCTRGWRLGGKGASGRNQAKANRIEEHGLHMWLGCYENAFRTIRECYDEWRPNPECPFQIWTDAFAPQRQITFHQRESDSSGARLWNYVFPKRPGLPGDGLPTLAELVIRLADWLEDHLGKARWRFLARHDMDAIALLRRVAAAGGTRDTEAATRLAAVAENLQAVLTDLGAARLPDEASWLKRRSADIRAWLRKSISGALGLFGIDIEQDLILANLGLALAIGTIVDILPSGEAGFAQLDEIDLREWLRSHGAGEAALASAFIRTIYDLGFAYPGGDATDPANGRGAAGAAARVLLEMAFGYKDSPLWRMNAGLGDTVFTPLFQVLEARGVRIAFFHRLTRVELSADRGSVGRVVLQRQADILNPPYRPLIEVGKLPCWPNQPLWEQL